MKNFLFVIYFFGGIGSKAQTIGDSLYFHPPSNGSYGSFLIGPAYPHLSELENYLQLPTRMGTAFGIKPGAMNIGASWSFLFHKILISTEGSLANFFYEKADSSVAKISLHQIILRAGTIVHSGPRHIWTAEAGAGSGSLKLTIENIIQENFLFSAGNTVPKNDTRIFRCSEIPLQLIFGYRFVPFAINSEDHILQGFMFGFDFGLTMNRFQTWRNDADDPIAGAMIGNPMAPFVRFVMSSGGFKNN